jgi:cobalamin biosynthesis Mg chelatase CobN
LIPEGLHVIGRLPSRDERLSTLKAMAQAMGIDAPELIGKLVMARRNLICRPTPKIFQMRTSCKSNNWLRPTIS